MAKTDEITEENIEEFITKAIQKYQDKGNLTDALFWRFATNTIKSKTRKETAEAIFKELESKGIINTSHYWNQDDNWYSCPKAPEGCSDESEGEECNCGTDKRIKNYEEIKKKFLGVKRE